MDDVPHLAPVLYRIVYMQPHPIFPKKPEAGESFSSMLFQLFIAQLYPCLSCLKLWVRHLTLMFIYGCIYLSAFNTLKLGVRRMEFGGMGLGRRVNSGRTVHGSDVYEKNVCPRAAGALTWSPAETFLILSRRETISPGCAGCTIWNQFQSNQLLIDGLWIQLCLEHLAIYDCCFSLFAS